MILDWIRALLPGVFAEVYHWKERALRAEALLNDVVAQYSTTIAHEREQHSAERRELLSMLAGTTSQKPPQPADEEGSGYAAPSFIHPINRIIQEYQASQASEFPDELVESIVDEYQRQNAVS